MFDNLFRSIDRMINCIDKDLFKVEKTITQVVEGNNTNISVSSVTKGNKTMSTITINGQTFSVSGNNVVVKNGSVYVDGAKVEAGNLSGIVEIKWEGELANLNSAYSVSCGDVKGNIDAGGSVTCKTVEGDVDCGGSVRCENVGGSIDCGGSVNCGTVGGDIDAGGSIQMKR
jgi:hypothetical protein